MDLNFYVTHSEDFMDGGSSAPKMLDVPVVPAFFALILTLTVVSIRRMVMYDGDSLSDGLFRRLRLSRFFNVEV